MLVDVSVLHKSDARTGIQRVVRALLATFEAHLDPDISLHTVAATRYRTYRYVPNPLGSGVGRPGSNRIKVRSGDVFLGLDLSAHVLPRNERQLSRWRRSGVRINIVIYDLLPVLHPEWFTPKVSAAFAAWLETIARQADNAVCISETVRSDLRSYLIGRRMPEAGTIRLGSKIEQSFPSRGFPEGFNDALIALKSQKTVLVVGTIEPRKGHQDVVLAFEALWLKDPQCRLALVLVGRAGWNTAELQHRLRTHPEAGQRLFWFDDASDEALEALYDAVDRVIMPSFGEGFGLPLIEAASHGKPILARDIAPFREIGGAGVRFFQNGSPTALADIIAQWLADPAPPVIDSRSLPDWHQSATDLLREIDLAPPPPKAN